MALTEKQKYDLNNMNVAAQNVALGDLIDTLGGGDFTAIQQAITALTDRVATLESKVAALESA